MRSVRVGTNPIIDASEHPRALAFSFATIWRALDEYLRATHWSGDPSLDIDEAHIRAAEIRDRNTALCGGIAE